MISPSRGLDTNEASSILSRLRIRRSFDQDLNIHGNKHTWNTRYSLFFICTSICVSYDTIWRFPALVYKFGLKVLITYSAIFVFFGFQLQYIDVLLGQYYSHGPCTVFKMCPILQGIGVSMTFWCVVATVYFVYIMANGLFLMEKLFYERKLNVITQSNRIERIRKETIEQHNSYINSLSFNYPLGFCLFISWSLVYLFISKRITINKTFIYAVFVTPFITLLLLLIMNLFHPEHGTGMKYLLYHSGRFEIEDLKIIFVALQQVLINLGIGNGVSITLGSYNTFFFKDHKNNLLFVNMVVFFANITSALMISANLGHDKSNNGSLFLKDLDNLKVQNEVYATDIQHLYFDLLSTSPYPELFHIFFNILQVMSGVTIVTILIEIPTNAIKENVDRRFNVKFIRFSYILFFFIMSVLLCYEGVGLNIIYAIDKYAFGKSLVYIELAVLIAICYLYGLKTFCSDVLFMKGSIPTFPLRVFWSVTPILFLAIIFASLIFEKFCLTVKCVVGHFFFLVILSPIVVQIVREYILQRKTNKCQELFRRVSNFGPDDLDQRELRSDLSYDSEEFWGNMKFFKWFNKHS